MSFRSMYNLCMINAFLIPFLNALVATTPYRWWFALISGFVLVVLFLATMEASRRETVRKATELAHKLRDSSEVI
jgi:bacteriorhodopsin